MSDVSKMHEIFCKQNFHALLTLESIIPVKRAVLPESQKESNTFISILLALCMVIGLMPITASADNTEDDGKVTLRTYKYVRSSEPKPWNDRARTSRAMTLANAQT